MRRMMVVFAAAFALLLLAGAGTALACPPPPTGNNLTTERLLSVDPANLGDLTQGDPFYYTSNLMPRPTATDSQIPHLPVYMGYMSTNKTYRFINIAEQVMTMLGEGKHGLWRIQENGYIREYLKAGKAGLPEGADIFSPGNLATIESDYSSFIPEESFGGYKDPFEPVNGAGRLNFVDLPITHPKYGGKYDNHVPVDLPHWYCTMSENEYPYAATAMQFAFAQPGANVVGPLGKRAGLDISELYTNVIRLTPMPDARIWVNVGTDTNVRWKAINVSKTKTEFYLYERPFFNVPYLFVTAVMDNKKNRDFRYVRPDGAYYDSLVDRGFRNLKTRVTLRPRFNLASGGVHRVTGTHLYGVHHPDRPGVYGAAGGGACPMKGGDWDGYPDTKGGSGWPTQYEETTPVCDGVLVDIKFFANLDGASWNSETKYLANAGVGTRQVTYNVAPGFYGAFVDPYHLNQGIENPEATQIGPTVVLTFPAIRPAVSYTRLYTRSSAGA